MTPLAASPMPWQMAKSMGEAATRRGVMRGSKPGLGFQALAVTYCMGVL